MNALKVILPRLFPITVAALLSFLPQPPLTAAERLVEPIKVHVESNFPTGITFRVDTRQPEEIDRITLRFQVIGENLNRYDHFVNKKDSPINLTHQIRTDTADRFIPPGSTIEYFIEIETVSGDLILSEPEQFILLDPRYEWQSISGSMASIYFYGKTFESGKRILEDAEKTIRSIGDLLQVDSSEHLAITVYDKFSHMKEALPPRSSIQETQLIVEGVFFRGPNVILILGGNRDASVVTSHETVHFLVDQALGPMTSTVPAWLNEGLAEFASTEFNPSLGISLQDAIVEDQLLPLTSLNSPPGDPQQVILFYQESRSVVDFMLTEYGTQAFQTLFAGLKRGQLIDEALTQAYGLDRIALENQWRASVGAHPLSFSDRPTSVPTPAPWPSITPFGTESLASKEFQQSSITDPEQNLSAGHSCNRGKGSTELTSILLLTIIFRNKPRHTNHTRQFSELEKGSNFFQ